MNTGENFNFTFCQDSASIWQVVGYLLLVFKVVIPIIIIIYGMIDLGKAVISSDDKEISKSAKRLLTRVIAGVAIFFVPTIVGLVFKLIGAFGEVKGQYDICSACITNPSGDTCRPCAEDSSSTGCTTVINNINAKYNS